MTAHPAAQRHSIIKRAVSSLARNNETSLSLWISMAAALAQIIGDAGFESILFRHIHQAKAKHAWLHGMPAPGTRAIDHLRACMAANQDRNSAEDSVALLVSFTDNLSLLIGELVTRRILVVAWGPPAMDDAWEQPPQAK